MRNFKLETLLEKGSIITSEKGNSMLPFIKSGQKHLLTKISWEDCEIEDIVYCKVKGRLMTHKVWAKDPLKGLQIGNASGFINGWTKSVFGKVTQIY
jgi:hypothetical protein